MFNRGNPIYDNLDFKEQVEIFKLNDKMSKYVVDLDEQRKSLKEQKVPKSMIDSKLDHKLRPTDDELLRSSNLWWKAFG